MRERQLLFFYTGPDLPELNDRQSDSTPVSLALNTNDTEHHPTNFLASHLLSRCARLGLMFAQDSNVRLAPT